MKIRALLPSDDRAHFSSGQPDLDRFFRQYAGQNQFRHHLGVTYVAVADEQIIGYVTVAPRHLEIEALPASERKGLPRYPIPVLGLARLAVDQSVQSQGVGKQLLRFVLLLAMKLSREVGCAGLVVDAKPEAVVFYEHYGFRAFDALEGESSVRPRTSLMRLPIRAVELAMPPTST